MWLRYVRERARTPMWDVIDIRIPHFRPSPPPSRRRPPCRRPSSERTSRRGRTPGLRMRVRVEFKFRTYLICRTCTAPCIFGFTACLSIASSPPLKLLHFGKIPEEIGQKLTKRQPSPGNVCNFLLKKFDQI